MKDLLILILTYKCNLNCNYCPIFKKNKIMSWNIAKKSLDLFSKLQCNNCKIKFFGGEPLLKFDLIKKIVEYNKRFDKTFKYELTTNGILLNKNKTEFFKKHNFELHISLDGDKESQISGRGIRSWKAFNNLDKKDREYVIVNIVVSSKQVTKFYKNFKFLYQNGFKKFNILPAFFNHWSDKEVEIFGKELIKIADFIKDKKIYIQNVDIYQENYLFNEGYVIDTNGDIYSDNKIMIKHFKKFKGALKLGNINNIYSLSKIKNKDVNFPEDKAHIINLKLDKTFSKFIDMIQ